jgi:hypothetical protein
MSVVSQLMSNTNVSFAMVQAWPGQLNRFAASL